MLTAARLAALVGGAALLMVAALTCASILGRALGPVLGTQGLRGDYEIVSALTGIAVFWFLPYVTATRGHARVTLLPSPGAGWERAVDAALAVAMTAVAVQLARGAWSLRAAGERTFLTDIPVWWPMAAAWPGAALAAAAAWHLTLSRAARAP
ncbi:MAG: TRAP transporter small permease [Paracoccaceae bacterium]